MSAQEASTRDPDFMLSLARGLAVMRAFSEHRRCLTISQISQKTAIPRAAVRRCLHTLQALGYVAAKENTFMLRPQIMNLGYAYLAATPLAELAQPYLERVSLEVHESCSLGILDGTDIVYIARSPVSRITSATLRVGSRLPAYCTSMGRVLLAHLPQSDLEVCLTQIHAVQYTNRTTRSLTGLRDVLDAARANGYGVSDQEFEVGLRSVAVPVHDSSGRVVAAMNCGAQATRVGLYALRTRIVSVLRSAATDLGATLITGTNG